METIARNIIDLADDERTVIEGLVGTPLADDQRIVVQVVDVDADANGQCPRTAADYAILADLADASMGSFDEAIQRSPGRDIQCQR